MFFTYLLGGPLPLQPLSIEKILDHLVFFKACIVFSAAVMSFSVSKLRISYFYPKFVSSLMVTNFSIVTDSIVLFFEVVFFFFGITSLEEEEYSISLLSK